MTADLDKWLTTEPEYCAAHGVEQPCAKCKRDQQDDYVEMFEDLIPHWRQYGQ